MIIDSHCHLTHPRLADEVEEIVERAAANDVGAMVTIGTGIEDARATRELARRFPGVVFATCGLDPFTAHAAGEEFDDQLAELNELLKSGDYCAVGEIGLDYHYDLDPAPLQIQRFEAQLHLASEYDLPVVIHVREAHEDMAAVLRNHSRVRGVIHSFTAGPAEAERYLELGWHLAFNGVVTFKNAESVRDAALTVPQERLLVETDSPYLAPMPNRGKRCEPGWVRFTLERIAQLRGQSTDELAVSATAATLALFALDPIRR